MHALVHAHEFPTYRQQVTVTIITTTITVTVTIIIIVVTGLEHNG